MVYFLRQTAKTFSQFALKSLFVFGLVIGTIFLGTIIFFNEAQSRINVDKTFTVSGTAKRLVTPDIAEITVGTIVQGKDIAQIQKDATEKINTATDKIKALDIPAEDIQTVNYNLTPERKVNSNEIESYTVNVAVKITVRNTDPKDEQVGNVVEAATEAGLNEVRSLYFKVDDEEAILDELKLEAIDDAKERGKALADKAGLKLGKLVDLSEGYNPYSYYDYSNELLSPESSEMGGDVVKRDESAAVQVQPGQFELTTTITLVYEIK